MPYNPYPEYNENKSDDSAVIPKFKRDVKLTVKISKETHQQLLALAQKYSTSKFPEIALGDLLEQIGLFALEVNRPTTKIDEESGISTDEFRQMGFDDATLGNSQLFLSMFGKQLSDEFQAAYMRGFMEGNYIRSGGK